MCFSVHLYKKNKKQFFVRHVGNNHQAACAVQWVVSMLACRHSNSASYWSKCVHAFTWTVLWTHTAAKNYRRWKWMEQLDVILTWSPLEHNSVSECERSCASVFVWPAVLIVFEQKLMSLMTKQSGLQRCSWRQTAESSESCHVVQFIETKQQEKRQESAEGGKESEV